MQGEGSIQNAWNHQSSNVEEGSVENVGLIESDSLKWQGCTAPILHLPPSSFCCHSSVSSMEPLMHKMVCKLSSSLCEKFIPSQPEIRISRMHVEAPKCNLANSKMMLESIELARGESRCYPICRTDMKP